MAGPAVIDPTRAPARQFSTQTADDTQVLLGAMKIIHSDPLQSAFSRLLTGDLERGDGVALAHFFEEISVLALRRHVAEDLLFDVFAIDLYWKQLRGDVEKIRTKTENPKFCENFEITARLAAEYRNNRS
ncbi:MAG TPA: hypothetical protein VG245_11140 [Candidatus Dormibacteraeota bacterium]|nr:hypothetical protein [Candidatus Dormibacteraeota bacterium]